jgi:hypothetical protein
MLRRGNRPENKFATSGTSHFERRNGRYENGKTGPLSFE